MILKIRIIKKETLQILIINLKKYLIYFIDLMIENILQPKNKRNSQKKYELEMGRRQQVYEKDNLILIIIIIIIEKRNQI